MSLKHHALAIVAGIKSSPLKHKCPLEQPKSYLLLIIIIIIIILAGLLCHVFILYTSHFNPFYSVVDYFLFCYCWIAFVDVVSWVTYAILVWSSFRRVMSHQRSSITSTLLARQRWPPSLLVLTVQHYVVVVVMVPTYSICRISTASYHHQRHHHYVNLL